jgi:hypothetical protein
MRNGAGEVDQVNWFYLRVKEVEKLNIQSVGVKKFQGSNPGEDKNIQILTTNY